MPPRRSFVAKLLLIAIAGVFGVANHACAQGLSSLRSYPLQNITPGHAKSVLDPLLPTGDTSIQVVVDEAGNRLLVSGSPEVHRIVAELIQSVDVPPRNVPSSNASRMEIYPCPPGQVDRWAQIVSTEFATRPDVRISIDRAAGQLVVIAPDDVHRAVAERLFGEPQMLAAPQTLPHQALNTATAHPRYYQLRNSTLAQVEPLFTGMLSPRLQPRRSGPLYSMIVIRSARI